MDPDGRRVRRSCNWDIFCEGESLFLIKGKKEEKNGASGIRQIFLFGIIQMNGMLGSLIKNFKLRSL